MTALMAIFSTVAGARLGGMCATTSVGGRVVPGQYPIAARSRLLTYDARHDECPVDFERFWNDVDNFLTEELATR